MKPYRLSTGARQELDKATLDCAAFGGNLDDLLTELERVFDHICEHPASCSEYRRKPYRFAPLRRFPYVIYYREAEDHVWITAIAHSKRRQGYWLRQSRDT